MTCCSGKVFEHFPQRQCGLRFSSSDGEVLDGTRALQDGEEVTFVRQEPGRPEPLGDSKCATVKQLLVLKWILEAFHSTGIHMSHGEATALSLTAGGRVACGLRCLQELPVVAISEGDIHWTEETAPTCLSCEVRSQWNGLMVNHGYCS